MSAHAEAECRPARVSPDQAGLPLAWQRALDDLAFVAAGSGQPWDCSGADLLLTQRGSAADLTVKLPDGRAATRPVSSPALVVPVGEALLAQPDLVPSPEASPPVGTKAPPAPSADAKPAETPRAPSPPPAAAPSEPRLLVDGAYVTRVSADVDAVWSGASLRVTVPFSEWSGAVWSRVAFPVKVLEPVAPTFSMHEIAVGLAVGRRLLAHPFELRVAGDVSFGVVSMDEGNERTETDESGEGSKADFRLGSDLQAAVPLGKVARFVVGADFEVTPAKLGGARTIKTSLPSLPGFSTGLSIGLGLGIP